MSTEVLENSFVYIAATEAHDDDGLPHTLEHLVFMGSEKYPYKVRQDQLPGHSFVWFVFVVEHKKVIYLSILSLGGPC